MPINASNAAATVRATGEQGRFGDEPRLAVEIYFYGVDEPIEIQLTGASEDAAIMYFENLKIDVINAQRHSRGRLLIRPFDRRQAAQRVAPLEIQRVLLVEVFLDDTKQDTDEAEQRSA